MHEGGQDARVTTMGMPRLVTDTGLREITDALSRKEGAPAVVDEVLLQGCFVRLNAPTVVSGVKWWTWKRVLPDSAADFYDYAPAATGARLRVAAADGTDSPNAQGYGEEGGPTGDVVWMTIGGSDGGGLFFIGVPIGGSAWGRPVRVKKDGGTNGTVSTYSAWTYSIYARADAALSTPLATGVHVDVGPPVMGPTTPAANGTCGWAYYDAGSWHLTVVDEKIGAS